MQMENENAMDTDPAPGGSSATPPDAGQKGPTPGPSKLVRATSKTHKVKDGGVTLYVLGDSHLRDQHGFPGSYAYTRTAGNIDRRLSAINRMIGEGKGQPILERGYTLTEQYLQKVLELVEKNREKAVVYFLSVGTNDLRDAKEATDVDPKVTVDDLLARFRTLMTKVSETPGAALFILEPIPCNRGIQEYRDQLDQQLESEIQRHERVRYVTLTHGPRPFVPRGPDGLYHSRALWQDDLHLNKIGARLIVRAFNSTMNQLGSEVFRVDPAALEPKSLPGGAPPARKPLGSRFEKGPSGIRTLRGGRVGKASGKLMQGAPRGPLFSAKRRLGPPPEGKGLPPSEPQATQASAPRSGPPADYYQRRRDELYAIFSAAMNAINGAEKEGLLVEEGTVVVPTSVCRPHGYPPGPGGPPPPPPPPSCGPPPQQQRYSNPYYYQDV